MPSDAMVLSEKELDSAGVIASTVVRVAFDPGAERSRKKILSYVRRARGELRFASGSLPKLFHRIAQAVYADDEDRFQLLYPYLDKFAELVPTVASYSRENPVSSQDNAIVSEFLKESHAKGGLAFRHCRDNGVSVWLSATREALRPFLEENTPVTVNAARNLAHRIVGIAAIVYDSLCGASKRYSGSAPEGMAVSNLVPHGMHSIRTALSCILLRDALSPMDDAARGSFLEEMDVFLCLRINPAYIDLRRSCEEPLRRSISRLANIRSEMEDAISDALGYGNLPLIVERLSFLARLPEPGQDGEPPLPWGHVALVLPDDGGNPFFYVCDGRLDMQSLTIREQQGEDVRFLDPSSQKLLYTIHAGITTFLASDGSASPTQQGGLFPRMDAEHQRNSRAFHRCASACNGILCRHWLTYPELFARLGDIDPLILIANRGKLHLLCDPSAGAMAQAALGERAQRMDAEETDSLCDALGISAPRAFAGYGIMEDTIRETEGAPEKISPRETSQRQCGRKALRRAFGKNVPNYKWFVEKLQSFGVTEVSEGRGHGAGSHRILRLGEGFETVGKSVWGSTGALPIFFVNSALERLAIPHQEFIDSAKKGKGTGLPL